MAVQGEREALPCCVGYGRMLRLADEGKVPPHRGRMLQITFGEVNAGQVVVLAVLLLLKLRCGGLAVGTCRMRSMAQGCLAPGVSVLCGVSTKHGHEQKQQEQEL